MRANLIAGLDIGTTRTCAVIGEVSGDPRRPGLTVLGVGQARTGGLRGDTVTHIEEMTESVRSSVKEAELMAGVSVDRVYAGIGGEHLRASTSLGVVAVSENEVTPDDVERVHVVARAVALPPDREMVHAIPQEYRVDHQAGVKDPCGMAGVRLEAEVFLVTSAVTAGANIRKAVNRAGYRVQELVLEPLAAARSVLTEDEKEVGVCLVEMGATTTDVAAYYEGKIRHVSILPFGGSTLTTDLVRGLSVPYAEAQKAKEQHGSAWARLVDPRETVEMPGPSPGQTRSVACWSSSARASSSPGAAPPSRGPSSWPSRSSPPPSASASPGRASGASPIRWAAPASPSPPASPSGAPTGSARPARAPPP